MKVHDTHKRIFDAVELVECQILGHSNMDLA